MAWTRCPECRTPSPERVDGAAELTPAEDHVFRAYRCVSLTCTWTGWSEEHIFANRPPTVYLRKRFGCPEEEPPAVPTLSPKGA